MDNANFQFIYGPVPSRRLGLSLGISPLPHKTCNYSCIYCQLGRTNKMTNKRQFFYSVDEIIEEFKEYLKQDFYFDVITIVGEGEPTLYLGLGELISSIKRIVDKPIAVITNGALLYDNNVKNELMNADFVLPSFDSFDSQSFKKINRPYGKLNFDIVNNGLIDFSRQYTGQLWLEIMLIKGYNDSTTQMQKIKKAIDKIVYNKLYINTPVRPPAESFVKPVCQKTIKEAINIFNGISIENLVSEGFHSNEKDDIKAVINIIKRHPMNQFEINTFLKSRKCNDTKSVLLELENNTIINYIDYKGYKTYRLK